MSFEFLYSGNNDVSISEFVSPLGSPVVIGDYIYSAYYTDADEGLNNGIYKINIGSGETEKAIDNSSRISGILSFDVGMVGYR